MIIWDLWKQYGNNLIRLSDILQKLKIETHKFFIQKYLNFCGNFKWFKFVKYNDEDIKHVQLHQVHHFL